jgi:RHS repeat-associated protein
LKSDLRFLYEGMTWNLVAEIETSPNLPVSSSPSLPVPRLLRSYAWGTDLSGSMTSAGGVGGLLLVNQESGIANQESTTAPCYDGNGNISAYVRVQSGTVSSRHDYDAFGRPVWNELEGTGGRQVAASPFGFSTKYADSETGWVYYGYRYLGDGRWLSRDPIEEQGGINLYGFVGNDPVNHWDYLGNMTSMDRRELRVKEALAAWRKKLQDSINELECRLLSLCPSDDEVVSNGMAQVTRQCCTMNNCRMQARTISKEFQKAADRVAASRADLGLGFVPNPGGWDGNGIAAQALNEGQTEKDADEGYGLKCTGWTALLTYAFEQAVLVSGVVRRGELCFGIAEVSKSNWYKLHQDFHAWIVFYGPKDELKTLKNYDFAIDPWQTGGANMFPVNKTYTPMRIEDVSFNK